MKNKSIFGPLTLIAAGLLWLLISMDVIPAANTWALLHLFPYLLIALGLGMVLRSRWSAAGTIVSSLTVVGAMAAVIFAPQLGWTTPPNWGLETGFGGSVPGSGKIETVTRDVSGFDAIRLEYPAEILIQQGESESVKFEADDNLLPQLSAKVENGTLIVRSAESDWKKRVDPSRAVKITIIVKELRSLDCAAAGEVRVEKLQAEDLTLDLGGAGNITVVDLDAKILNAHLDGVGSVTVSGTAQDAVVRLNGLGSFLGDEFESAKATTTINGAGSVHMRVKNQLTANINGAGSVEYYGDPKVTRNINGAGSVTRLGK